MDVYIPTTDELAANITDKVISVFAEMVFIAPKSSYEQRSTLKLVDVFDAIDKKSYGALKSFVNYCTNTIRYYKDEKSTVLLKQVISEVNKFLEDNYYFLA